MKDATKDQPKMKGHMGETPVESVLGGGVPPLGIISKQITQLAGLLEASYPGHPVTKIRVTVYLKTRLGGKLKETVTKKFEQEKKGS